MLINIHTPVNTTRATTVANALKKHMETIPLDRKVLIEGEWSVALAAQDRETHIDTRSALAQQIPILTPTHKMIGFIEKTSSRQ
jgi:hypothetical protein